jgi:glycosyltransferase involved in cell wall biosynthesis
MSLVESDGLRILYLGLVPPVPTTNGHRVRFRSLLSALSREGHEVALVCFANPDELASPAPELKELCTHVHLVPAPPKQTTAAEYWGRLSSLLSPASYGAQRFYSKHMSDMVRNSLESDRFDAVICDDVYMLSNLPPNNEIPVLLDKHDITYEVMERFLDYERNPLKRLYGRLEYQKVRRLETDAYGQSTAVLACSERDAQLIRSVCREARISILPNVIDVESYQPTCEDDAKTLLFVGAMDYFPNRDAVDYFIAEMLPVLRRSVPGCRFVVAGRNPSSAMLRRYSKHADVEFTGSVADMRPIIAQAAVCVVPLRIGSGTRLKILEAAAMGKAIVSTRLGAEGLEFLPGEEIVLADEPEGFATAIAKLLADPSSRRMLGQAARRRVERHYDVSSLQVAVRAALGEFAQLSTNREMLRCGT